MEPTPQVGSRAVNFGKITDWIEKKLRGEFKVSVVASSASFSLPTSLLETNRFTAHGRLSHTRSGIRSKTRTLLVIGNNVLGYFFSTLTQLSKLTQNTTKGIPVSAAVEKTGEGEVN